jgi:hypothetical protein
MSGPRKRTTTRSNGSHPQRPLLRTLILPLRFDKDGSGFVERDEFVKCRPHPEPPPVDSPRSGRFYKLSLRELPEDAFNAGLQRVLDAARKNFKAPAPSFSLLTQPHMPTSR